MATQLSAADLAIVEELLRRQRGEQLAPSRPRAPGAPGAPAIGGTPALFGGAGGDAGMQAIAESLAERRTGAPTAPSAPSVGGGVNALPSSRRLKRTRLDGTEITPADRIAGNRQSLKDRMDESLGMERYEAEKRGLENTLDIDPASLRDVMLRDPRGLGRAAESFGIAEGVQRPPPVRGPGGPGGPHRGGGANLTGAEANAPILPAAPSSDKIFGMPVTGEPSPSVAGEGAAGGRATDVRMPTLPEPVDVGFLPESKAGQLAGIAGLGAGLGAAIRGKSIRPLAEGLAGYAEGRTEREETLNERARERFNDELRLAVAQQSLEEFLARQEDTIKVQGREFPNTPEGAEQAAAWVKQIAEAQRDEPTIDVQGRSFPNTPEGAEQATAWVRQIAEASRAPSTGGGSRSPSGYRWTTNEAGESVLEAIPGGPAADGGGDNTRQTEAGILMTVRGLLDRAPTMPHTGGEAGRLDFAAGWAAEQLAQQYNMPLDTARGYVAVVVDDMLKQAGGGPGGPGYDDPDRIP